MWWRLSLCVLCVVHAACGGPYLLPGDMVPSHYDVRFVFDIDPNTNFSYYGAVDIAVTVKKSTSKLILHAKNFYIPNDKIQVSGPNYTVAVSSVDFDPIYNFLTIGLNKSLERNGNYTLTIPFLGTLDERIDGVFVSSYVTANQTKEYVIATQFQPIAARKGFPCLDEPRYKATFKINIGHPSDYTAISNMLSNNISTSNALENIWPWDVIEEKFKKNQSSFVWTQFNNSMPMSTSVVAFTVSKFSYVQSPEKQSTHIKIRAAARSDAINETWYALHNVAPKALKFYENYFNVSYPLPKFDMVALPKFAFGASGSWGLTSFVENLLLFNSEQSSLWNQQNIAGAVTHELAHQWFGNLVTMRGWSDLWLNEGFATYIASMGVTAVEPNWGAETNVEHLMAMLARDALLFSHPVSFPVDDPLLIPQIFDKITYYKSASLMRMLNSFLGEYVFKKAINNYVNKYSYGNAEQEDLWDELTTAAAKNGKLERGVSVKNVMDSWTLNSGYPLLTVERDYSDGSFTVTQKRFLLLSTNSTTSESWWVPMMILLESKTGKPVALPVEWLDVEDGVNEPRRVELNIAPNKWLLFNDNMIVPCRVNYDMKNWQLLIKTLSSHPENIPETSRVQLISDAFSLAWTNMLNYSTALQLVNYVQHENKYLPLSIALKSIAQIDNLMKRTADHELLQNFVNTLINATYRSGGGLFNKFRSNGQHSVNTIKMQVLTSEWACRMNMPGCEQNALDMLNQWMATEDPDSNNQIPVNFRPIVYCSAIRRGGPQQWKFILQRKRNTKVDSARAVLVRALACSQDVWLLKRCLEWCVDGSGELYPQDKGDIMMAIINTPAGYYAAREFIYDRIGDIINALRDQPQTLGSIFRVLLNQFTTQRELDQFLNWIEKNKNYLQVVELGVDEAIEIATANIAWVNNNRQTFVQQLKKFTT